MTRKQRSSLSYDELPAVDREPLGQATRKGGLFEKGGPAAHWTPVTLKGTSKNW